MFSAEVTTTTTVDEHPKVREAARQLEELEANLTATQNDLAKLRDRRTKLARQVLSTQASRLLADPAGELTADAGDAELAALDGELMRAETRAVALVSALAAHRETSATVRAEAAEELALQARVDGDDLIREMVPLVHRVIELNTELITLRGGLNAALIQALAFPLHPGILEIWLSQPQVQLMAAQLEAEGPTTPTSKKGRAK